MEGMLGVVPLAGKKMAFILSHSLWKQVSPCMFPISIFSAGPFMAFNLFQMFDQSEVWRVLSQNSHFADLTAFFSFSGRQR